MPKLPRISGKEIIRALEILGFIQVRQRGSHVIMTKETSHGKKGCTVPLHDIVAVGTLSGILRQADVDSEEFKKSL
jgi:predicted RNA binding protein YcfA (HicA-like mRNA interferase family)